MIKHEIRKATSNRSFKFIFVFFIVASFLRIQLDLCFSPIPAISNPNVFSEVSKDLKENINKEGYLKESIETYKIYLDI